MTSAPDGAISASNLITRVNVGDSLTRTADRLPDKLAVVDGAAQLDLRRVERPRQPGRELTHGPRLCPRRRAGAGVREQLRVPRHLLRVREARRRLRSDEPGLAGGRDRVRARSLRVTRHRGRGAAVAAGAAGRREGARGPRRGRRLRHRRGVYEPACRTATWLTFKDLHDADDAEPEVYVGRPRPDQLPLHERHDVVPEGRGRQPPRDLPRVAHGRRRERAQRRRPGRVPDAAVPYRAAERFRHADRDGGRDAVPAARVRRTALLAT